MDPTIPVETALPPSLMISPSGEMIEIPANQAGQHQALGYAPASPKQIEDHQLQQEFGGAKGMARAGVEGAAQAATMGLSDVAFSPDPRYREANPGSYLTGQVAGIVAPALLTAGASAPEGAGALSARGLAELSAPSLISKAGRAVAGGVEGMLPEATSKLGKLAVKLGAEGAGSAVEGAFFSTGNVISEAALGDPNEVAQSAFSEIGLGAALGFGLGGLTGAAAETLPNAINKIGDAHAWAGRGIRDYFVEKYPELVGHLAGADAKTSTEFLLKNRNLLDPGNNRPVMQFFTDALNDTMETGGTYRQHFLSKISNDERAVLAQRLGVENPEVDAEVERLAGGIGSQLKQMKDNPGFTQSSTNAVDNLYQKFLRQAQPDLRPIGTEIDGIIERISSDPNLSMYVGVNSEARKVVERLSAIREGLDTFAPSEIEAVQGELNDLGHKIMGLPTPERPPPLPRGFEATLAKKAEAASALKAARAELGAEDESVKALQRDYWKYQKQLQRRFGDEPWVPGTPKPLVPRAYGEEIINLADSVKDFHVTPTEKLDAMLQFKRDMGTYISPRSMRFSMDQIARNTEGQFMRMQSTLRDSLHDPKVWGDAGARLAETDTAIHEMADAFKNLNSGENKLYDNNRGRLSVDKVSAWFKKMGTMSGDSKLEDLGDYLDAAKRFGNEFKKSYTTVGGKELDAAALDRMIEKTASATEQFRTQATAQRMMKELAPKGGGALGGFGEVALGGVLGPVGAGVGALHSIYKFSKNVPAAVATLTTLESVASRVNNAIKSAASTLVRGGVKAARVVRGEAAAGIAQQFKSDYSAASKRYVKQVAEINKLANNPDGMHAALLKQTEGWQDHAPKAAQAFQTTSVRAVQYLSAHTYAPAPLGPFSPPYRPSLTEMSEYQRRVDAINNPVGVLKQAAAGSWSPEAIDAVKNVYPQLYAKMVSEVLATAVPDKLSYQSRLAISALTGQDVDGSTLPLSMNANQATFVFPKQDAPQPGAGNGPGRTSTKFTVAERAMTPLQAVESGAKS